jgi:hypothetical protein
MAGHDATRPAVDLYWIPLGAGAHVVRLNGKVFEAASAFVHRRQRCDLYHSALKVIVPEGVYAIEMTPIPDLNGADRGVVAEGSVGARWAGRFRVFRYEIRRWRDGVIPDLAAAVASPVRLTEGDLASARRVLDAVPWVPTVVWGRDELRTGDMWNSNSVVSWVLTHAGFDPDAIPLPPRARAPGWDAGTVVARRQGAIPQPSPASAA